MISWLGKHSGSESCAGRCVSFDRFHQDWRVIVTDMHLVYTCAVKTYDNVWTPSAVNGEPTQTLGGTFHRYSGHRHKGWGLASLTQTIAGLDKNRGRSRVAGGARVLQFSPREVCGARGKLLLGTRYIVCVAPSCLRPRIVQGACVNMSMPCSFVLQQLRDSTRLSPWTLVGIVCT